MKANLFQLVKQVCKASSVVIILLIALLFTGCSSETIFQSNFDATTVGQPPAHNQQVGTVNIDGPVENVKVVTSPVGSSGKWVQIIRTNGQQSVTGLQCNNSKFIGDGEYVFSTVLFIPSGSGLVMIKGEDNPGWMHEPIRHTAAGQAGAFPDLHRHRPVGWQSDVTDSMLLEEGRALGGKQITV